MALLPVAKNIGTVSNPYWKIIGTQVGTQTTTLSSCSTFYPSTTTAVTTTTYTCLPTGTTKNFGVGAIANNTSCCPTRIAPCCEKGLDTEWTTTTKTGLGDGGGIPKGQLNIIISGLKCNDKYMGNSQVATNGLGNGFHSLCLVHTTKNTLNRITTFVHPVNNTGISYTTLGKAFGKVDYSRYARKSYSYTKSYKMVTEDGNDFYARYKKLDWSVDYDKDLRVADVPTLASSTGYRDNHKSVRYDWKQTYRQWRFKGSQIYNSTLQNKERPTQWQGNDITSLNFHNLQWDWNIDRKKDMSYSCGAYGYSCLAGGPTYCRTRDTTYRRENTKHIDTAEIGHKRLKKFSKTVNTPAQLGQDFSYDMLHPNGYIFHVTFITSGYSVSPTTSTLATNQSVARLGHRMDLYFGRRPHNVQNGATYYGTRGSDVSASNTGTAGTTTNENNAQVTNSCNAVTGITGYTPTTWTVNRDLVPTYKRHDYSSKFTKTRFAYLPFEAQHVGTDKWWLQGTIFNPALAGGSPNNW